MDLKESTAAGEQSQKEVNLMVTKQAGITVLRAIAATVGIYDLS